MATKLNGKKKGAKPKGGGKKGAAAPATGPGHNLVFKPRECKAFFDQLDNLHSDHESDTGNFMSDCKNVYEKMSDKTGIPRAICRTEYNRRRQEAKRKAREAGMEPGQFAILEGLRDALGSLGAAAERSEARTTAIKTSSSEEETGAGAEE